MLHLKIIYTPQMIYGLRRSKSTNLGRHSTFQYQLGAIWFWFIQSIVSNFSGTIIKCIERCWIFAQVYKYVRYPRSSRGHRHLWWTIIVMKYAINQTGNLRTPGVAVLWLDQILADLFADKHRDRNGRVAQMQPFAVHLINSL